MGKGQHQLPSHEPPSRGMGGVGKALLAGAALAPVLAPVLAPALALVMVVVLGLPLALVQAPVVAR